VAFSLSGGFESGWYPCSAVEEVAEGVEFAEAPFGGGGQAGLDDGKTGVPFGNGSCEGVEFHRQVLSRRRSLRVRQTDPSRCARGSRLAHLAVEALAQPQAGGSRHQ
jgi:hypothetical protein